MTLLERDERMREEGRKEGKEIANLNSIKNLMETLDISAENAMDLVKIPAEEREKYREKLQ
jgi:predicted transposase YdaD